MYANFEKILKQKTFRHIKWRKSPWSDIVFSTVVSDVATGDATYLNKIILPKKFQTFSESSLTFVRNAYIMDNVRR